MGRFSFAVSALNHALDSPSWVRELAGIFPLSALIDFIDIPSKIHIFELTGAIPLWSWPITPSGSRILLSPQYAQDFCYLDKYGATMAFLALDGRYGDNYVISSPETVRLCLSSQPCCTIPNHHQNMFDDHRRVQNLEVVKVTRLGDPDDDLNDKTSTMLSWLPWGRGTVLSSWYCIVSATGWTLLVGMLVMSAMLQCYLTVAFLAAVPLTGLVVSALYGFRPRKLLVDSRSSYNRLVLITEHMNSVDWTVFYGESTIVNSLLNRPLEPIRPAVSPRVAAFLSIILRVLILGQWGLVIAVASLKSWDAFFVTFWVIFCIFSHAYLIPPSQGARDWMKSNARIQIERIGTQVSSRRALLNTIIALNPDTFAWSDAEKREDRTKFDVDGTRWVNPVLAPSVSRSQWEEATRLAMNEAAEKYTNEELASSQWHDREGGLLGVEWNQAYPTGRKNYWKPFILEGIHMAAKIRREAAVPGRRVSVEGI